MARLFIASDHRGFAEKQRLLSVLNDSNIKDDYEVIDLGPIHLKPEDDFNDAAIAVARSVRENPSSRGILICGTGTGMCIAANRFKGIRAFCGYTPELTHLARMHNDGNVLCLSADFMDDATIDRSVSIFLSLEFFAEERYIRRKRRLDDDNSY